MPVQKFTAVSLSVVSLLALSLPLVSYAQTAVGNPNPAAPVQSIYETSDAPTDAATELVLLQIEPGTGNLVLQTTGGFVSSSLDTDKWPRQLTVNLYGVQPSPDIDQQVKEALDVLKAAIPQATGIEVGSEKKDNRAQMRITLQFDGTGTSSAVSLKAPKIIANTGSLVTIALKQPSILSGSAVTENPYSGVTTSPLSTSPLANLSRPKSAAYNKSGINLHRYFADVDTASETSASVDGVVRQAWLDYLNGNNGSAIMGLRPYVDRVPDDVGARYLLISSYMAAGEYTGAERELKTLVLQNQNSLPLVLDLVNVKLDKPEADIKRDTDLAKLLSQALGKWPDHPGLQYASARYALAKGNLTEAEMQLAALLEGNVQADYFVTLGDLETKKGNSVAARSAYLDALTLAPDNANARWRLGLLEKNAQNLSLAETHFSRMISAQSLVDYADLLMARQEPEQALAALHLADLSVNGPTGSVQSLAKADENKPVLYALGQRFASLRDNRAAERNLKLYVELVGLKPASVSDEQAKNREVQQVASAKGLLQQLATSPNSAIAKTPAPGVRTSAAKVPAVKSPATKSGVANRAVPQNSVNTSPNASAQQIDRPERQAVKPTILKQVSEKKSSLVIKKPVEASKPVIEVKNTMQAPTTVQPAKNVTQPVADEPAKNTAAESEKTDAKKATFISRRELRKQERAAAAQDQKRRDAAAQVKPQKTPSEPVAEQVKIKPQQESVEAVKPVKPAVNPAATTAPSVTFSSQAPQLPSTPSATSETTTQKEVLKLESQASETTTTVSQPSSTATPTAPAPEQLSPLINGKQVETYPAATPGTFEF